jgi:Family of unknown function (DUF6101)
MFSLDADADATPFGSVNPRARIEADDPRADDRLRVVAIDRQAAIIHRSVACVMMTIRVPSSAYRAVILRLTDHCGGVRREVRLTHRDPDLSVLLAESDDEAVAEACWRNWACFFSLPALVERIEPGARTASFEVADIARGCPRPRRGGRASTARRPRFLARRKVGHPSFAAPAHANPCVLFPGSKFDR